MTYQINESERERILGLHGITPEVNYLKERLESCKFTKDGKYVLFENNIYSSETGDIIPLTEKWTLSDTFHTIGDLASAGLDFVIPGAGAIVDTLNAISYIIEAQFKTDQKDKTLLYVMAAITFGFVLVPGALQASIIPLKVFIKTGKGAGKPAVKKGMAMIAKLIDKIVLGVPRLVNRALKSTLGRGLLGKFGGKKIVKLIDHFISSIKGAVDIVLGVAAKEGVETAAETAAKVSAKAAADAAVRATTKSATKSISRLSIASAKKFFKELPHITRGKYVMKKFGFQAGKQYGYVFKSGLKGQRVTILKGMSDGVVVKFADGRVTNIPINQFLRGTVGAPWAHKAYSEAVPLFVKMFARSILPDGSGLNEKEMAAMADLDPDQTSLDSLAWLRDDLAGYEGDKGQYTINPTAQAFQNALLQLGYSLPRAGADGKFGPETQKALKQFQLDTKLETSSGKMDRLTANQLSLELRDKGVSGSEDLQKTLISL